MFMLLLLNSLAFPCIHGDAVFSKSGCTHYRIFSADTVGVGAVALFVSLNDHHSSSKADAIFSRR